MKRLFSIIAAVLALLLIALVTVPFLFQDKIRALVQTEIDRNLNARVQLGAVNLSFLRNFPDARIGIRDFAVVGKGAFEADTLAQGRELALVVDLLSVLSGSDLRLKKVLLDQPRLYLHVLPDGAANWDIALPDSSAADTDTAAASTFRIALQQYRLTDADIRYQDETLPMDLRLAGMNHQGSGDLTATVYDLRTQTDVQQLSATYDGIAYLDQARLQADATLHIDITSDMVLGFKENRFLLNDLPLSLDGTVILPAGSEDIRMDLTYAAAQSSFRSLLSLLPAVYAGEMQGVQAEGELVFDGYVRGTYNEKVMPGFALHLHVPEGRIQYPDVPQPITNIRLDLDIESPEGDYSDMQIDISALHLDLGTNPIDARASIRGTTRIDLDGEVKAHVDLAELAAFYPLEGTTLRGRFDIDATARGVYDEAQGAFPQVDARMKLAEGYLRQAEYPAELSDLSFEARMSDVSGNLADALLEVPAFHLLLDGEPIDGSLMVRNFDDPNYHLRAAGTLDLEKLMQVYPVEGMGLKGRLFIENFDTRGTYSAIEAERYLDLPTRGALHLENFEYREASLPAPVSIARGAARFTPERLELTGITGQAGRSDFALDGYLSNYLAYALSDQAVLRGDLALRSSRLDIDEWMSDDSGSSTPDGSPAAAEAALEAVPVPPNLDVHFQANIGEVLYSDLVLSDFQGSVRAADAALALEDVRFGMLGGQVAMSGMYNTAQPQSPAYNFYLDVESLEVAKAFAAFSILRSYAPALRFVQGIANVELGITGLLGQDMMPKLEAVNSLGLFQMQRGGIEQLPLLTQLSGVTKLQALTPVDLKEMQGKFEIKDGYLRISPIDLRAGETVITLGGSQSLAGKMDYTIAIDAPSGRVDQAATQALGRLTGVALQTSDRVVVNLRAQGPWQNPRISGAGGGTADQVQDQLTQTAEDKLAEQLGTRVQLEKDSLRGQVKKTQAQIQDSIKAAAQEAARTAAQRARDSLANLAGQSGGQIKEEVKQQAGEIIGQEAEETLKNLKDKFGFPTNKKNKNR
ncbi:MAG: hypothetical protein OHK0039_20110 [Bacteroidia bacterium]